MNMLPVNKIKDFVRIKPSGSTSRTKFGGQPDWLGIPQWPLSREAGTPMKFIGQIDLSDPVYREFNIDPKMAYIFMTEEDEFIDETFLYDGGENAVIIQPDGTNEYVIINNQSTGPTHSAKEYFPTFTGELLQPPYSDDSSYDEVVDFLYGHGHLGGYPCFIQGEEYPGNPDDWFLLAQMDGGLPFEVNFGDDGNGYVFMHKNGRQGAFLWQCH